MARREQFRFRCGILAGGPREDHRPSSIHPARYRADARVACLIVFALLLAGEVRPGSAEEPIALGGRRELFVDSLLIAEMTGDLRQHVHQPEPKEVVLVTGQSWEGNTCAYYTLFQDGDLYRMYYRGSHADEKTQKSLHPEVTCYAESPDGIHWTKPELGLFEWDGSRANNIVLMGLGTHCFVPFRDENPDCPPEARYKGISRGRPVGKKGLYVFQSPDGIHWSLIRDEPVITEGAFDSQNLAFWDPVTRMYVAYHRTFTDGVRAIMTCTSRDFVNWSDPVLLQYPGAPHQHLYTNTIRPYPRAPHLRIGFPTRYIPEGSQVEPIFMASRDGVTFQRWNDPVIPRTAPADRDGNRSNYMANGLLQLPGHDREYAVYGTEAYYSGPDSRLRRFMYRVDGFVSVRGGQTGGTFSTKPITFAGRQFHINYACHSGGSLRVELQRADGTPIDGYRLADCGDLTGDEVEQVVAWRDGPSVEALSGQPVRLRFEMYNADLFAVRFE